MNRIKGVIKKLLHIIFKCNILKTLYLNFKMLPFNQAVKLPIWIYGKMTFRSLAGKIIIDSNNIYSGMIRVGKNDWYIATSRPQTIWTINGTLKFKGNINILHGGYILVSRKGVLEIGSKGTLLGSDCKIICFDNIVIGDNVRIAWEIQMIDSSFHYVETLDVEDSAKPLTKPIRIGDFCWIGNRTTISKGTVLPDYTIVASNSLVNKNYLSIGSYNLLTGVPAISKAQNLKRVFDAKLEKQYDEKFNYDRTHL